MHLHGAPSYAGWIAHTVSPFAPQSATRYVGSTGRVLLWVQMRRSRHLEFVPQPDSSTTANNYFFDHLVGAGEQRRWYGQAEWTAFRLGAYQLASFVFHFLRKMIASCRLGGGR
jgi:hypothetical protein